MLQRYNYSCTPKGKQKGLLPTRKLPTCCPRKYARQDTREDSSRTHARGRRGARATTVDADGHKKEVLNPLSYLPNYL